MTYRRIVTSAAAIMLATTGMTVAQTDSQTEQMPGQSGADQVTCAQISAMDTATVPGVLYFVSGYSQGQRESGNSMSGSAGAASTGTATGSAAATDSNAASGSGADTSAMGNADSEAAGSGSSASETTSSQPATGNTAMGLTPQIGSIAGYFEIPVEQIMVACQSDPNRTLSEVLEEEGQRQSATGAMSSTTGGTSSSGTSASGTDGDDTSSGTNSTEETTTTDETTTSQ